MSTTLFLGIDAAGAARGAREFSASLDEIIGKARGADRATADLSSTHRGYSKSTIDAAVASKNLSTSISHVSSVASMAGSAIKGLGIGIVASLSVGAIIGYADVVTKHFGDIADAATRVGASAQEMQVLRQVFIGNASSAAELGTALEFLQAKTGDALTGNAAAVAAFERLGITTEQLSATQGNAARQLELIATAIRDVADPSERAAALLDLLGRSGKSTQVALSALGDTLDEKVARALKDGTILSEQMVKNYDALSDETALLNEQAKVLAGVGLMGIANAWAQVKVSTLSALVAMQKYMSERNESLSRKLDNIFPEDQKPVAPEAAPKPVPAHQIISGMVAARDKRRAEVTKGMEAADKIGEWKVYEANQERIAKDAAKRTTGGGGVRRGGGGGGAGRSDESFAMESESLIASITQKRMQAYDDQIGLIELARDKELEAINNVKMAAGDKDALRAQVAETATQQIIAIREKEVQADVAAEKQITSALSRIDDAWLQSRGGREELIIKQRDEELAALAAIGASEEDAARARVQIAETASQEILQIRRQEAAEIESLERENVQQRASTSFGEERKGYQIRLVQMEREARLADLQSRAMPEQTRQQATALITDTANQRIAAIDPTPWDAARTSLAQFGEGLTSVEGMTQGVIQGIANIGNTAASAFADAIMSGEDFETTLKGLGESLTKMMIQMTMQMAMQQALGAGASGLASMMGPSSSASTAPTGYAGVGYGETVMARGGVVQSNLRQGVYIHPTYFETQPTGLRALAKGGVVDAELDHGVYSRPTYFPLANAGEHKFAKGTGLLGEAGPEAVLPLTRTPSGNLGVETTGAGGGVTVVNNVTVNNMSKANVKTEERDNSSGGRDLILTIADEVENIVAGRLSRSGTKVNRAASSVGQIKSV